MGAEAGPDGTRRLDTVLDPAFSGGLVDLSLQELRRRRTDAQTEEARLSYLRRLLQGRLDIVCAHLQSRSAGSGADLASLLGALPGILGDSPDDGHRTLRVTDLAEPDRHERRVEALVRDETLAELPETSVERLGEIVERLRDEEAFISAVRRRVHAIVDAMGAELTRRYADGRADVDRLLEVESAGRQQ